MAPLWATLGIQGLILKLQMRSLVGPVWLLFRSVRQFWELGAREIQWRGGQGVSKGILVWHLIWDLGVRESAGIWASEPAAASQVIRLGQLSFHVFESIEKEPFCAHPRLVMRGEGSGAAG